MRKAVGMSDNLRMERFLWFHDRVKRGAYPDVEVLAPAGLREAVIADIAAMRGVYGEAGGG
jgi:hypothetical protein